MTGARRVQSVIDDIIAHTPAVREGVDLARIGESARCSVIGVSAEGTITSWNTGAERLYGLDAAEIIGKSIDVLMEQEDQDNFRKVIARICAGNEVAVFAANHLVKGGRSVEVSLTMSPIRDSSGDINGVSMIASDISGQRSAEVESHTARVFQEAIIDGLPGLFFVLRPNGQHVRWNSAVREAAGQSNGAMPQTLFIDLVASSDRKAVEDMIGSVFAKGRRTVTQAGVRLADGAIHQYLLSGTMLESGHKSYLVGFGIELGELPAPQTTY